jgi:hypothetical protein
LVVHTPSGKIVGVEVKSGTATRTAAQKAFDSLLNSRGQPFPAVGEKAAEIGVEEVNKALVIKVP